MNGKGKQPMASVAEQTSGISSVAPEIAAPSSTSRVVPKSAEHGLRQSNILPAKSLHTPEEQTSSSPKPAMSTGKKKWGKVRMMAAVQGTMGDLAENMREEAKRQMQLRLEARKKMEMRTRLFKSDDAEYDGMEYLPGLHRAETFVDELGLKKMASTLKGADGIVRSTTMSMVPQKPLMDQGGNDKTRLIFAALRGKLPHKALDNESLIAQATDDIALDVALEETANVHIGKDGGIYKKYSGFDHSVDNIIATMKRDVFGRSVRPWKALSKSERSWLMASWIYIAYDFVAIIFFAYLAFFLFRSDTKMDPLAWQLAFGMTAVFTAIHMFYLVFELIEYFSVWLMFVVCLTVGLFYGGVNYFLQIYTGEFTCFHSSVIEQHAFGVCYEGRLLLGMMLGCCSLLLSALFLWQWRIQKRLQLKRRGEYTEKLDLEELLTQVDLKFEKYKLLGGKEIVSDTQSSSQTSGVSHTTTGVGRPLNGIVSFDSGTKPEKQRFLSRILSPAKGVNHNITSTTLRGSTHAVPKTIQLMPHGASRSAAFPGVTTIESHIGTSVRPRVLGQSSSDAGHGRDTLLDCANDAQLEVTVGKMKHTKYAPQTQPGSSANRPSKPYPLFNQPDSTKRIGVAAKQGSQKTMLIDGMPSIAPLERTATFARKSMRKMNVGHVSTVLNTTNGVETRPIAKQN